MSLETAINSDFDYGYTSAAPQWDHDYVKRQLDQVLAPLPRGSRILDVGCGNGALLATYRDRGWSLVGLEHSKSGIAVGREAYPEIEFHQADATDRFPDMGQFDCIISAEVVEHVYDPQGFARNCYSALRPGGLIALSTPYHGYLKWLAIALLNGMDRHHTSLWTGGHIKFWSYRTLGELLATAGFQDLRFAGAGRLPFLWKSMVISARKPGGVNA